MPQVATVAMPRSTAASREASPGGAGLSAAKQRDDFRRSAATWAHIHRCRAAGPPPGEAEVARLVAEFYARGGAVAVCPPVHLLPVQNGTGRTIEPSRRTG